jgi:hypothetical protein
MNVTKLSLILALTCVILPTFAQSFSEFIIIDELREDIEQLVSTFGDRDNMLVIEGFSPNAIEQISNSLEHLQIEELHIYTATKPGAIVFGSISITSANQSDWAPILKEWAHVVSDKVIIHSEVVFSGAEGIQLKQELEHSTGLSFKSHN